MGPHRSRSAGHVVGTTPYHTQAISETACTVPGHTPMKRSMILAVRDLIVCRRGVVRPRLFGHHVSCDRLTTVSRARIYAEQSPLQSHVGSVFPREQAAQQIEPHGLHLPRSRARQAPGGGSRGRQGRDCASMDRWMVRSRGREETNCLSGLRCVVIASGG